MMKVLLLMLLLMVSAFAVTIDGAADVVDAVDDSDAQITISVNKECSDAFGGETLLVQSCNTMNQIVDLIPIPNAIIVFLMGAWIFIMSKKEALSGILGMGKYVILIAAGWFLLAGMGVL